MKRIYAVFMMTALMFAAAGCLNNKTKTDAVSTDAIPDVISTASSDVAAAPEATVAEPKAIDAVQAAPAEIAQQSEPANAAQAAPVNNEVRTINLKNIVPTNTPEVIPALQKLVSTGNVVIDFYAPWCGPCKIMSPIIDALSQKYPEIIFVKVDIDAYDAISEAFELAGKRVVIKGIPAFYFLKNGVIVDKVSGGMSKEAFEKRMAATFTL